MQALCKSLLLRYVEENQAIVGIAFLLDLYAAFISADVSRIFMLNSRLNGR